FHSIRDSVEHQHRSYASELGVLLAAAVCTKGGKPLVSRQFVENMTRSRIEGILTAFPKLMTGDKSSHKQHTFVETDSVRYVYQPIDQLYVVLITTKNSNILEDLETLRLFSRVIPEYCKTMDEKEILDNAFQLIFAFDEIVAIGYRESVSLAQIRTFTDMDSHEERVYYQIKKSQEEEAKKYARDKARELTKAKLEAAKKGIKPTALIGSSYGSQSAKYEPSAVAVSDSNDYKPSYTAPTPKPSAGSNKALRLGAKTKDVDTFVDQLKSEGQDVSAFARNQKIDVLSSILSTSARKKTESVHIKAEEKLKLMISRDGKVNEFDVAGCITLRISDENLARIKLRLENNDKTDVQLQTHPNLDKRAFQAENMLVLKNAASKPYPVNVDVGILKWRFHSDNDAHLPLSKSASRYDYSDSKSLSEQINFGSGLCAVQELIQ
uniref:Coatomer subunit delta n=1 Tax=Romanomermis culicivorax TaxID=13658 RepID=A0A915JU92_ROMCU